MTQLVSQNMVAAMRYLALSGNNQVDSPFSTYLRDVTAPDGKNLASVTVTAPGTGYTVGDPVTITGGGGADATAEVLTINGSGGVLTVKVKRQGSGYTGTPAAAFGGTGSGATGTAVMKARDFYVSYEEENDDDFFKRLGAQRSARSFGGGVWVYLMSWGRTGDGSGMKTFRATYRLRCAVSLLDMGPKRQEWKDYALAIHDAVTAFVYTGPDQQTLGLNATSVEAMRGTALEQHRPGFKVFDVFYEAMFMAAVMP